MSTQMTVRLSDEAAGFVDDAVRSGFDSRAAFITWLVEREAQRELGRKEIGRMKRDGIALNDPEMDAIAKAASATRLEIE